MLNIWEFACELYSLLDTIYARALLLVCRFTGRKSFLERVSDTRLQCWTLSRLGKQSAPFAPILLRGLFSGPPETRNRFARTLAALGADASWALHIALESTRFSLGDSTESELEFGNALAEYFTKLRPGLHSHLGKLARSVHVPVRVAAGRSLADSIPGQLPDLADVRMLLSDPSEAVVRAAVAGLLVAETGANDLRPAVVEAWNSAVSRFDQLTKSLTKSAQAVEPEEFEPLLVQISMLDTARWKIAPENYTGFADYFLKSIAHEANKLKMQDAAMHARVHIADGRWWLPRVQTLASEFLERARKSRRITGSLISEISLVFDYGTEIHQEAVVYFLHPLLLDSEPPLTLVLDTEEGQAGAEKLRGELGLLALSGTRSDTMKLIGEVIEVLER